MLYVKSCVLEVSIALIMHANVDSLSLALGQISFAVSDLTKKNYKATLKELHEVSYHLKSVKSEMVFDWTVVLLVYLAIAGHVNILFFSYQPNGNVQFL